MKTGRSLVGALVCLVFAGSAAAATPPDVGTIVRRMKTALEPDRASARRMTLTISAEDGESSTVTLGQARKSFPDGPRVVTVVLAPQDRRGIAFLTRELPDQSGMEQSVWVPAVRRVRTILPVEGLTPFLDSDFTLADLGFVGLRSRFELVDTTSRNGVPVYQIKETPQSAHASWYYSRIFTWLRTDSALPVERQFYDPSGTLWKDERFEDASIIDGTPTVIDVRMDDRMSGGSSEIHVDQVSYDAELSDELFESKQLRHAVDSPLWTSGAMVRRTAAAAR
jgi:hypothetical protein